MAFFFTITSLFLFQISYIFAEKATCLLDNEVVTELENRYDVNIFEVNLNVSYNIDDIFLKSFPNPTIIELLLTSSNTSFKGFVKSRKQAKEEEIHINFRTEPITILQEKEFSNDRVNSNCRLTSSQSNDISMDQDEAVKATIILLTEHCIQTHMCNKFDSIITNDRIKKEKYDQDFQLIIYPSTSNLRSDKYQSNLGAGLYDISSNFNSQTVCNCESVDSSYNPQSTINAMIDFGTDIFITQVITKENNVVIIPDVFIPFETGSSIFLTTGELIATNGTFEDLTSLKRIDDVIFKHDQLSFSVASTYHLGEAKLEFSNYKVRYGKIKISGELSVDIDGITIAAIVVFDFNQKPCKLNVIKLENKEFGEVHVKMTGLGILNSPAAKIISWVIKSKTFDIVKNEISKILSKFDCEQFRPNF